MRTFDGLKDGTVLISKDDEEMTVAHVDWDGTGEKEFCLVGTESIFRGIQFDPQDWQIKQ